MKHWGKREVTREDVIAFLREKYYDENILHARMDAFDGMTADDYAYMNGWTKTFEILKGCFG